MIYCILRDGTEQGRDPDRSDLTNHLQTGAPSTTSLETIQGIATYNSEKALPYY
jgi:hypothetical protein